MVYKCVVPNCGVIYANASKIKLYRFPTDEVLKSKWMKSCSITKYLVSYKVCGNHFLPEDIKDNGRLIPSAVPSIQLGVNLHPNSENSSQIDISTINNSKPNGADSPQRSDTSTSLITDISPTQTSKKGKFSLNHPRYFNDLTIEHFSTPNRAKIYLAFAKQKHNDVKKKTEKGSTTKPKIGRKIKMYQYLIRTIRQKMLLSLCNPQT
ncbi:uncharacterized protein LOC100571994 [Acyrthosiphon pisum]|uniref:THAP-type domain-containing protein n=1 Tax=Acyrthosiphon pisum TaxID=7029 RepID=A0A8R2JS84_ACYPI|nr:uncharacterized protein LOC100571994 [Acyrthosiphon pisum]XP_029345933.1 uncharacterized protein LOC100571994 [Acyrthosiphon pisum]XP_029345934.1 uncharacterized protein LOC100571994 [Acyrthosiphon pisum]